MTTETSRRYEIETSADRITVTLYATLDGTEYRVYGYGVRRTHKRLAERLGAAWQAKAIGGNLILLPRIPEVGGFFASSTRSACPSKSAKAMEYQASLTKTGTPRKRQGGK